MISSSLPPATRRVEGATYEIPNPQGNPKREVRTVILQEAGTILGRLANHALGGDRWHHRMADVVVCYAIRWISHIAVVKWFQRKQIQMDAYGEFFWRNDGLAYEDRLAKYVVRDMMAYPLLVPAPMSLPNIPMADEDATLYGSYMEYVRESCQKRVARMSKVVPRENGVQMLPSIGRYLHYLILHWSLERRVTAYNNLSHALRYVDDYCRYTQVDSPLQHLRVMVWFDARVKVPGQDIQRRDD